MSDQHQQKLIETGRFLGYPSCCIDEFVNNFVPAFVRSSLVRRNIKNGYIPCPQCAAKLEAGTTSYDELINANRICSIPFQRVTTDEEERAIHIEIQTAVWTAL